MQQLTTKEKYRWYQGPHHLKTLQSIEEQSKQRKTIEQESKQHGINIDDILEEMVLSNKNCFWSLLQSQTDRMHHYYHQQEQCIIDNLNGFERTGLLTSTLLEYIEKDAIWLQEFVTYNISLFELAVSEFDAEHHVDTYEEEMKYFEETYPFTNRKRLSQILDAIHVFSFHLGDDSPRNKIHFTFKKYNICNIKRRLSKQSTMKEARSRSEREKSKDTMRRVSVTDEKSMQKKNKTGSFFCSIRQKLFNRLN